MPRRSKRDIFEQARPTVESLIASLTERKDTETAEAVQVVLGLAAQAVKATDRQAALDAKLDGNFSVWLDHDLNVRAYENTASTVTEDVKEGWEKFLAGEWEPVQPVRAPAGGPSKTNATFRAPKALIAQVEEAAARMVAEKGWPTTRGNLLNARHVAAQWLARKYPAPAAGESEAAAE